MVDDWMDFENFLYQIRRKDDLHQIRCFAEKDGNLYVCYEDRTDPEASGVSFVLKVAPEMWVESYCEVSNG